MRQLMLDFAQSQYIVAISTCLTDNIFRLKCNRGHPCDNCTRRADNTSCTYAIPSVRKKSHSSSTLSTTPDEMQTRIDRLEGLVLSLITSTERSGGARAANKALARAARSDESHAEDELECEDGYFKGQDESEVDEIAESVGIMKVDNDKPTFASEVHWYAILSEVCRMMKAQAVVGKQG